MPANTAASASNLITAVENIKSNIGKQVPKLRQFTYSFIGHSKCCGNANASQKFLTDSVFEEMELVTEVEDYKEEEELTEDQLNKVTKELTYFVNKNMCV